MSNARVDESTLGLVAHISGLCYEGLCLPLKQIQYPRCYFIHVKINTDSHPNNLRFSENDSISHSITQLDSIAASIYDEKLQKCRRLSEEMTDNEVEENDEDEGQEYLFFDMKKPVRMMVSILQAF